MSLPTIPPLPNTQYSWDVDQHATIQYNTYAKLVITRGVQTFYGFVRSPHSPLCGITEQHKTFREIVIALMIQAFEDTGCQPGEDKYYEL